MSTQHTPGPWSVVIPEDWPGRQETFVRATGWGVVALCAVDYSLPHCVEKQKANALLIAAAPDLLQALRDAVAALGGINSDNVPDTVREAIARATGDTE